MLKSIMLTTLAFSCTMLYIRCVQDPYNLKFKGLKPIYEHATSSKIEALSPRVIDNPGKILQSGNFTYQVDNGKGIHIIDCSDLSNPKKLSFIKVDGITEIHQKENTLLIDHKQDLVSLLINTNGTVSELDRVEGIIKLPDYTAPAVPNTYFECPDKTKGNVIGWEQAELINPKCKTAQ